MDRSNKYVCPKTHDSCYAWSERDAEAVLGCVECGEDCPGPICPNWDESLWHELRRNDYE